MVLPAMAKVATTAAHVGARMGVLGVKLVQSALKITYKALKLHPFILFANVLCMFSAAKSMRRARFYRTVRFLEQLDEASLKRLVGDLPAWVKFSDYERAHFLNDALKAVWPALNSFVSDALRGFLEEVMEEYAPTAINGGKFERFSFGDMPLTILGIKSMPGQQLDGQAAIVMDCDVRWAGVPDIVLTLMPRSSFMQIRKRQIAGISLVPELNLTPYMSVRFTSLQVVARLRWIFSPVLDDMPLVGAMRFSFIDYPKVDFDMRVLGGADLMSMPALSTWLHELLLGEGIESMLWPNTFDIPFLGDDDTIESTRMPLGVLSIEVASAHLAPRMTMLTRRRLKVSPLAILSMRPHAASSSQGGADEHQVYCTRTQRHTTDPQWSQTFHFTVFSEEQTLRLIMAHDRGGGLDSNLVLGQLDVPIKPILRVARQQRMQRLWAAWWVVLCAGRWLARVRRRLERGRSQQVAIRGGMGAVATLDALTAGATAVAVGSLGNHHDRQQRAASAGEADEMSSASSSSSSRVFFPRRPHLLRRGMDRLRRSRPPDSSGDDGRQGSGVSPPGGGARAGGEGPKRAAKAKVLKGPSLKRLQQDAAVMQALGGSGVWLNLCNEGVRSVPIALGGQLEVGGTGGWSVNLPSLMPHGNLWDEVGKPTTPSTWPGNFVKRALTLWADSSSSSEDEAGDNYSNASTAAAAGHKQDHGAADPAAAGSGGASAAAPEALDPVLSFDGFLEGQRDELEGRLDDGAGPPNDSLVLPGSSLQQQQRRRQNAGTRGAAQQQQQRRLQGAVTSGAAQRLPQHGSGDAAALSSSDDDGGECGDAKRGVRVKFRQTLSRATTVAGDAYDKATAPVISAIDHACTSVIGAATSTVDAAAAATKRIAGPSSCIPSFSSPMKGAPPCSATNSGSGSLGEQREGGPPPLPVLPCVTRPQSIAAAAAHGAHDFNGGGAGGGGRGGGGRRGGAGSWAVHGEVGRGGDGVGQDAPHGPTSPTASPSFSPPKLSNMRNLFALADRDDITGLLQLRMRYTPAGQTVDSTHMVHVSSSVVTEEDGTQLATGELPGGSGGNGSSGSSLPTAGVSGSAGGGGAAAAGAGRGRGGVGLVPPPRRAVLRGEPVCGVVVLRIEKTRVRTLVKIKRPLLVLELGGVVRQSMEPGEVKGGMASWDRLFTFPVARPATTAQLEALQLNVSLVTQTRYQARQFEHSTQHSNPEWAQQQQQSEGGGTSSSSGGGGGGGGGIAPPVATHGTLVGRATIDLTDIVRHQRLSGSWKLLLGGSSGGGGGDGASDSRKRATRTKRNGDKEEAISETGTVKLSTSWLPLASA